MGLRVGYAIHEVEFTIRDPWLCGIPGRLLLAPVITYDAER
jgi:hypothetical protein